MRDLCRILYNDCLIKLYQSVKMSWKNKFDLIEVITNKARAELAIIISLFPLPPLLFKLLTINNKLFAEIDCDSTKR